VTDRASLLCLRATTVLWGLLGTGFALLMIRASTLDTWWQIQASSAAASSACFC
jgi:hypothetical protein